MALFSRGIREVLCKLDDLQQKVEALMTTDAEVQTAVETLKTDVAAKLTAVSTELTKLEGEISNPATLEAVKTLVGEVDSTVNAFTVPTT